MIQDYDEDGLIGGKKIKRGSKLDCDIGMENFLDQKFLSIACIMIVFWYDSTVMMNLLLQRGWSCTLITTVPIKFSKDKSKDGETGGKRTKSNFQVDVGSFKENKAER